MKELLDHKPRIIVYDIETSRTTAKVFGMWGVNIKPEWIVEPGIILCISWKELGKKKVHHVSCFDEGEKNDDRNVIETFHKVLMDTDIAITHNGDKFDHKWFMAQVIKHELDPLPPIVSIDTLKEVRKIAKFSHNRLDFLGKTLGIGRKIHTDISLWDAVEAGDEKAMKKMLKYCDQDVRLLEDVYMKLRPYIKGHPNLAEPYSCDCPKCGSSNVKKHKIRVTRSGVRKRQFQCQACGSYFTERLNNSVKPDSKL